MTGPCLTCALVCKDGVNYRCDALRLADPAGNFVDMPTRTGLGADHHWPRAEPDRNRVSRWLSPGPVEGWRRDHQTDQRVPFVYQERPCPAWRP